MRNRLIIMLEAFLCGVPVLATRTAGDEMLMTTDDDTAVFVRITGKGICEWASQNAAAACANKMESHGLKTINMIMRRS